MRRDAGRIFQAGLSAVDPAAAIRRYCRRSGETLAVGEQRYDLFRFKRIFVVGGGKAGAPMARAVEGILGDRISAGAVNVKYGHVAELDRVQLTESGHPVPDENGLSGARSMLELAAGAGKDDLVLCLISGGGSALLPLPAPGLTLADKQETTKVLLACGATIHEINAVRKHLSRIKGGRLAQAVYPATLATLVLSDVIGDDLDVIASGPTVADSSTFQDCADILSKYDIRGKLPGRVVRHIKEGTAGRKSETPKPGTPVFSETYNLIIGCNFEAIMAAKHEAEQLGYASLVLSSMLEGETRYVAQVHGAIGREILKSGNPLKPPACILSGGETTVTLKGKGLGGRNQEFSLAAAMDIAGCGRIVVFSAGTDGTDGPTDAAGAIADSTTIERAESMGLKPGRFLEENDSYHFFRQLEDLFITGPTNTNVMDLRIMLVS